MLTPPPHLSLSSLLKTKSLTSPQSLLFLLLTLAPSSVAFVVFLILCDLASQLYSGFHLLFFSRAEAQKTPRTGAKVVGGKDNSLYGAYVTFSTTK